jgi:hypothetical protein
MINVFNEVNRLIQDASKIYCFKLLLKTPK